MYYSILRQVTQGWRLSLNFRLSLQPWVTWRTLVTPYSREYCGHIKTLKAGNWGHFPFVRTDRGQTIPVAMIISFLIKSWIVSTNGNIFHQKLFEKAYFIFKLSSQAWFGQPVLTNGKCPEPILSAASNLHSFLVHYSLYPDCSLFTVQSANN